MMIRPAELAAIRAGTIDLAFRRWAKPRVVVGTRMRTAVGLVEVTSVEQVSVSRLRAEDARRAGSPSLAALQEALAARPDDPAWRIGLVYAGPDPREALRSAVPDAVVYRTAQPPSWASNWPTRTVPDAYAPGWSIAVRPTRGG